MQPNRLLCVIIVLTAILTVLVVDEFSEFVAWSIGGILAGAAAAAWSS